MPTHPWRLRILLLVLAATALAAVVLWQPVDPRLEAYLRREAARGQAPGPGASNARPATAAAAGPAPAGNAAAVAQRLASYGVVMNLDADGVGKYFALGTVDSAYTPEELGFVRAGALLDGALELEAVGTGGLVAHVRVSDRAPVDSALHHLEDGCDLGVPVPLAGVPRDSSWFLALPQDAVELLPASAWVTGDSAADAAEAVRLAQLVPGDTQVVWTGLPIAAQLFAGIPFDTHTRHFVSDGVEVLTVVAQRTRETELRDRGRTRVKLIEQRVVIAEREAGSGRFRAVWSRYAAFDEDERNSEEPFLPLRLGRARLLTILTRIEGSESYGGAFISRVAPGTWRRMASWIGGC